jgi:hypothetical protein
MHTIENASEHRSDGEQPLSFAKASIGFVMSTTFVSAVMVVLGSI